MNYSRKLNFLGLALCLFATVAWGTSFYILKETIETVNELFVISIRFLFAGLLLALIFIKNLRKTNVKVILKGCSIGLVLVVAYVLQTYGLGYTTPSRNAFLTSAYCVMVPFIYWFTTKKAPKVYNVLSAILCIVGIGFVALSNKTEQGSNLFLGDGLTLISAVFYALQIIFIAKHQESGADPCVLLIMEVLTVGVISGILSLAIELPTNPQGFILNSEQIFKIAYLTIVCTLMAQMGQMFGQKFTSTNQASLILSLEAVFGTLFSVVLGDEKLTSGLIIGFSIIFIAILINELKLDPLKLFNNKKSIE